MRRSCGRVALAPSTVAQQPAGDDVKNVGRQQLIIIQHPLVPHARISVLSSFSGKSNFRQISQPAYYSPCSNAAFQESRSRSPPGTLHSVWLSCPALHEWWQKFQSTPEQSPLIFQNYPNRPDSPPKKQKKSKVKWKKRKQKQERKKEKPKTERKKKSVSCHTHAPHRRDKFPSVKCNRPCTVDGCLCS